MRATIVGRCCTKFSRPSDLIEVILAPVCKNKNCNLCRKLVASFEEQIVFCVDSMVLVTSQRTFKSQIFYL